MKVVTCLEGSSSIMNVKEQEGERKDVKKAVCKTKCKLDRCVSECE